MSPGGDRGPAGPATRAVPLGDHAGEMARGARPGRRGPGFFFVHLQKTAGTALLRRLRHHFGPDHVYPTPAEQGTPEVALGVERMQERVAADASIEVVTGHLPLCAAELLPGPPATFTLLRDPVERTLSFLRHQREVDPRFAEASLEEVYEAPVTAGALVTNHMVKMLSMTLGEMTEGALTPLVVDEARIERARTNLADRVDVMGLQEHFDEFCADLEDAYGWDLGPPGFMNRTAPAPASDALRDRIRADNGADLALYRSAVELWRDRHPG